MIVVIDGPAGSGKSSTAKAVAKNLSIEYIDSGALYRACTWLMLQKQITPDQLAEQLDEHSIRFKYEDGLFSVFVDDKDVSSYIRTQEVSENVSPVATHALVRDKVNKIMRHEVESGVYIADGRDLGTVVFPNAALKIFLIADPKIRAERRLKEMREQGDTQTSLQDVLDNIVSRDKIDSEREIAPLKKAADAVELDTGNLKFDEQVSKISSYISELSGK